MTAPPAPRIPVAVLGATGAVGQTFIRLLAAHPWFEVAEVAASERSAGRPYREAARWLEGDMPAAVADRTVVACTPEAVRSPLVFSALDSSVAGEVEAAFARDGRWVLSNAKNYRMEPDVPLVIAEVNPDHLALVDVQRRNRGWSGAIVTNANCAAIVAAMALAPLHEAFGGVRALFLATMQATSGAGYPGVPSLDILGNVIPFIREEEEKVEIELCKILGRLDGGVVRDAPIRVSAHCNRVPVEHGHTVCMSVGLDGSPSPEDAAAALAGWRGHPLARDLPSTPPSPVLLSPEPDRPQPRRDVQRGGGMTVTVGRVRRDHPEMMDLRLVAMGHNVVRGAAGASVQNAELLVAAGRISRP